MAFSVTTAGIPDTKRFDYWRDSLCGTFVHLDFLETSDRPFYGELVASRVNKVTFTRIGSGEYKIVQGSAEVRAS